jgi:hypothetical protein
MLKRVTITSTAVALAMSGSATAGATGPNNGSYTFTGTAALVSGPANCMGGSSAAVTGDGFVSNKAVPTLYLHIKGSAAILPFGATLAAGAGSPINYGQTGSNSMPYVLLTTGTSYRGQYLARAYPGYTAADFKESVVMKTQPLTGTGAGVCTIRLTLSLVPGINKGLLQLFGGVL